MEKLTFDIAVAENYKSKSQRIRVLSEKWILQNLFCPRCGNENLNDYDNNKPVADFYCDKCQSDFELKSKAGSIGSKIVDGAYDSMITRITSTDNPHFLFLNYSNTYSVTNLIAIPNTFFTPDIIEKRKPLGSKARRAGWTGCNILFNNLPESGKIFIVKNNSFQSKESILHNWNRIAFVSDIDLSNRGWLFKILKCIDQITTNQFSLDMIYQFEDYLSERFPNNKNIKPKIRQQLQVLRDAGYLEFLGKGNYQLVGK